MGKKVSLYKNKRLLWGIMFILLFIITILLFMPSPYYKANEVQQTIDVTAGTITTTLKTEIGFADANGSFLNKQHYAILDENDQEITYIRACAKIIISGKNFDITKAKDVKAWVRIEILIQWEKDTTHHIKVNVGTITEEANYTADKLSLENGAYVATYDRSFKLEYYISRWYKEWTQTNDYYASHPFYIYVTIRAEASGQDEYGIGWETGALYNDYSGKFYYYPPSGTIKVVGNSGTWSVLGSGTVSILTIIGVGIIGFIVFSIYTAKQPKRSTRRRKR